MICGCTFHDYLKQPTVAPPILLNHCGAGCGALGVLCACSAGDADCSDNFSCSDERYAAFNGHCSREAENAQPVTACGDGILQLFCGPLELRRGPRLFNGNIGAG